MKLFFILLLLDLQASRASHLMLYEKLTVNSSWNTLPCLFYASLWIMLYTYSASFHLCIYFFTTILRKYFLKMFFLPNLPVHLITLGIPLFCFKNIKESIIDLLPILGEKLGEKDVNCVLFFFVYLAQC